MTTSHLKNTFARRVVTIACYKDPAYWSDEADEEAMEVEFYFCAEHNKKINPLNYQSRWVYESRGFVMPAEIQDSMFELSLAAQKDKANFMDLVVFAQTQKKAEKIKPTLAYDSRITEPELAEELNLLSKLIIKEEDLDSLNARRVLIGGLANYLVGKSHNKILADLYLQITTGKAENACDSLTFSSAVQLDCYANLYHRHLTLLIHDNANLGINSFKRAQKIIARSLKKFSKVKLDAKQFEILNVKQMQKNLLAVLAN